MLAVGDKVRSKVTRSNVTMGDTGHVERRAHFTGKGQFNNLTYITIVWDHNKYKDGGWWDSGQHPGLDQSGNCTTNLEHIGTHYSADLQDYSDYYTSITEIER